jgi:hypothetical protein
MPYDKYRKELIAGYYDYQLEGLMSGYDPAKPTIILLPGGMGSQLERTEHEYPASPNVINDVVWMDLGVLPLGATHGGWRSMPRARTWMNILSLLTGRSVS